LFKRFGKIRQQEWQDSTANGELQNKYHEDDEYKKSHSHCLSNSSISSVYKPCYDKKWPPNKYNSPKNLSVLCGILDRRTAKQINRNIIF